MAWRVHAHFPGAPYLETLMIDLELRVRANAVHAPPTFSSLAACLVYFCLPENEAPLVEVEAVHVVYPPKVCGEVSNHV